MIQRLLISTPSNLSPVSFNNEYEFDNGRIFYRLPQTKLVAIYVSGGLFGIGWWAFIDALLYSEGKFKVEVGEVLTGVIATIGMIIVASIDKTIFSDEFYVCSRRMLRRARLLLFFGFTLIVGSIIGSVAYFVYKYYKVEDYNKKSHEYNFGTAVVVQNGCILMSSLILLIGQYSNNEPKYDFL